MTTISTLVAAKDLSVVVIGVGDESTSVTTTDAASIFLGVGDGVDESGIVVDSVGRYTAVLSLLDGLDVLFGFLLGLVLDEEDLWFAWFGWGKRWKDDILSIIGFLDKNVDQSLLFVLGGRWDLWDLWSLVGWGLDENNLVVLLGSAATSRNAESWCWEVFG